MTWRMIDLFSGIGGFSLAASWTWPDLEIVAFCEIDKFCQKVLRKHWPDVPIVEDVRDVTLENTAWRRKESRSEGWTSDKSSEVQLLTGGFPCQPFSCAGKRKGKEDNRFLWPEMLRIIQEVRPRWVVAENVAGIVRMALDDCLSDLEGEGYSTQAVIIPACSVNAPHRRDRVWIVAHPQDSDRWGTDGKNDGRRRYPEARRCRIERIRSEYWLFEPNVGRVAHGVPSRVDRLKSLGNAIVPQVAYQIFRVIREIEEGG